MNKHGAKQAVHLESKVEQFSNHAKDHSFVHPTSAGISTLKKEPKICIYDKEKKKFITWCSVKAGYCY